MSTNKVFGVATAMYNDGNHKMVIYHNTPVVSYNDLEIVLNSNGYRTATTKRRMNQVSDAFGLGFHVYQKDNVWYVDYKGWTYLFYDKMMLQRKSVT